MSSNEDLDEYDSELELRLRKEYSSVFPLFRYCVLTQEATYLCNQLEVNFSPQASYPFFDISMEDVWVWDKNRPSRIIPKAQVYTVSDVTIEQLKGDASDDFTSVIPDDLIDRLRQAERDAGDGDDDDES